MFADVSSREVTVKHLGVHPSVAGGATLHSGEQIVLGESAVIELLPGQYKYCIFIGKRLVNHSLFDEKEVKGNYLNIQTSSLKMEDIKYPRSLKSFFTSSFKCKWRGSDSLLMMSYGNPTPSSLVASFDLDGTLIETKSGRLPFRSTPDDWRFWHHCVPSKLRAVHSAGYRTVIFTNQGGMPYGNPTQIDFQIKIQAVMESLGKIPVLLLAAISDNQYRKPGIGMWTHFIQHENDGVTVDMNQCFYIGDAAGRNVGWKKGCVPVYMYMYILFFKFIYLGYKKDFSCTDRKFSANISLSFHTPEEYFLGEPPCDNFSWGVFNPHSLDYTIKGPILEPKGSQLLSPVQELIVFVGCPASGKTTFYKRYMPSYSHVSRDVLGTWQKCVSECERMLQAGRSVVVDNTSPDIESRSRYTQIAIKMRVQIRCFVFTTPVSHAIHNNRFRELTSDSHKNISRLAYDIYQSKYVEPTCEEGFTEIVMVTMTMEFPNEHLKCLYKQFYE